MGQRRSQARRQPRKQGGKEAGKQRSREARNRLAWKAQNKNFARVLCFRNRDFAVEIRTRQKMDKEDARQGGSQGSKEAKKQASREAGRQGARLASESQNKNFARALCFQNRDFAAKLRMRREMKQGGSKARRQPGKQGGKEAGRQRSREARRTIGLGESE